MKVEAEIATLFVFRAHNKYYSMGCYYPEDDWEIIVTSEDLLELENKVAEEIVNTGITIDTKKLYVAEHLLYQGSKFCLRKLYDLDAKGFLAKIKCSHYYLELKEKRKAEKMLEDEKLLREHKQQLLESAKKTVEELEKELK